MPIYEYSCPACGAATERLRKASEREQALGCPSCGAAMRPVLSAAAVAVRAGSPGKLPIAACDAGPACCGGGCGGMN